MRCTVPRCGVWSQVLETRTQRDGSIKRTHECANGHRFGSIQRPEPHPDFLARRNRQLVALVRAGVTITEAARRFGLASHSEASRIVKRMAPELNARSAGQSARWRKGKST